MFVWCKNWINFNVNITTNHYDLYPTKLVKSTYNFSIRVILTPNDSFYDHGIQNISISKKYYYFSIIINGLTNLNKVLGKPFGRRSCLKVRYPK